MPVTLEIGKWWVRRGFSLRPKFRMLDAAGAPVAGLLVGGFTVYRSKRAETPVSIVRTITELSAANMPGTYEIQLTSGDLDVVGETEFRFTAAGAEPTVLSIIVVPAVAFKDW